MRILVSDSLSQEGVSRLEQYAPVDQKIGLNEEQLIEIIDNYDALIVRSVTKVTAAVIKAGKNLKVIGRAGVGVDNIDVEQATKNGVMVINAPEGNTISTAEHSIAMLTSLARNIPQAHQSLKNGCSDRSGFMGVELNHKVLGIIGLGRIGGEVARRARGMGMSILAYDPYVTSERAEKIGVQLVPLEEVIKNSDFITLHLPRSESSYHLIGAPELAMMKEGVRLINCARGGLVDEEALYQALVEGKVAGAAMDVFEKEPPLDNPLLALPNVIVTPHLGASTREAQINVAVQVAEQVIHALKGEAVTSAVNVPALLPEVMAEVTPYMPLMRMMGSFYIQNFGGQIEEIEFYYRGAIAGFPTGPLTTSCLIGLLSFILGDEQVNFVNAPLIARERGIRVREVTSRDIENFANQVVIKIKSGGTTHSLAGTVFNRTDIRITQIDDYRIEVIPSPFMLVCIYKDRPGVIGRVGALLGDNEINIAGMQVGRESAGGEAVMVLQIDESISPELLQRLEQLEGMKSIRQVLLRDRDIPAAEAGDQ